MQDQRMSIAKEASVLKPRKKKPSTQKTSKFPTQVTGLQKVKEQMGPVPSQTGKKASKRVLTNEVTPLCQQQEKSTSDSLADYSTSGNEYRALRRKYLLLEEESFGLGRELNEVEDEVKTLEQEKLALLDELVVLEGLVHPSEFQSQGTRLH